MNEVLRGKVLDILLAVVGHRPGPKPPTVRLVFSAIVGQFKIRGEAMQFVIPSDKALRDVTVQGRDDAGRPAAIDKVLSWTASDPRAALVLSEDGQSLLALQLADPAAADADHAGQVQVKADVRKGDEVVEATAVFDYSFETLATAIEVVAGTIGDRL